MAVRAAAVKAAEPERAAAAEQAAAAVPVAFRDRIVGLRRVKASELRANPKNWRVHPETQRGAVSAMLGRVGFVDAVMAREVDGHLELIDGHLRTDLAGDAEVPVLVVDLDEREAAEVLATFDPLTGLALVDQSQLAELIEEVDLGDHAELRRLLTSLHYEVEAESERKAAAGEADPAQREIPGMALNPHEHYDYLVVLASTTHEWNVLCERLGLAPASRRRSMGTCRGIKADRLLRALGPAKVPQG